MRNSTRQSFPLLGQRARRYFGMGITVSLLIFTSMVGAVEFLLPSQAQAASTLNFTELATHPGAAVQVTAQGKTINKLKIFNGKLYAAYGDYNANTGPISINPFDLTTNTFNGEALSVPTESLGNWKVVDGKLYTTTIDPTCSGTCPAGYAVGDSSHNWQMKTPVNAEHIFDIETLTGTDIWLFGSAGGGTSTAWRSIDGGDTFDVVQTYANDPEGDNTERYYWGAAMSGKMFMQSNYLGNQNPVQSFDGADWGTSATYTDICRTGSSGRGPSHVVFGGDIICFDGGIEIWRYNDSEGLSNTTLNTSLICSNSCNSSGGQSDLYVDGQDLYSLTAVDQNDGEGVVSKLMTTKNLNNSSNWRLLEGVPVGARSMAIDPSTDKIYVGTTDSKIYVADLPAPDVIPPSVNITSPANGQTINSSSVTLTANVSDDNSGVARVEFFIGNDRIASDTQSPYRATWKNQYTGGSWQYPVGQYQFTAVAYDLDGNSQQSSAVTVTINPPSDITIEEFDTGLGNGNIAVDNEDNVWFTTVGFQTGLVEGIHKLNTQTGQVEDFATSGIENFSVIPFNAMIFSNNRLWTVDCANNEEKIEYFDVVTSSLGSYDVPGLDCSDQRNIINVDSTGRVYVSGLGGTNRIYVLNQGDVSQIELVDGYGLASFAVNAQDQVVVNFVNEDNGTTGIGILDNEGNIEVNYQQPFQYDDPLTFLFGFDTASTSSNDTWVSTYPDFELALSGDYPLLTRVNSNNQVTQIENTTGAIAGRLLPGSNNGLWFVQSNGMVGRVDNGSSAARLYAGLVTPFPEGIFGDAEQTALANELYLGLYSGSNAVDSQGNMWLSDPIQARVLKITANAGFNGGSNQDSDPIPDTVENAAPNNGDGNNDGTPDSEQAYVTSLPIPSGPNAGTYISLAAPSGTTITATAIQQVTELASTDIAFDYPLGLMAFTIEGLTPGSTIPIELYYYASQSPDTFTPRKYNPNTQAFTALSTQTTTNLSQLTIDNQPVLKLSYQLTDGGPLDQDGIADGNIVDPVGLGVQSVGSPNTGIKRF